MAYNFEVIHNAPGRALPQKDRTAALATRALQVRLTLIGELEEGYDGQQSRRLRVVRGSRGHDRDSLWRASRARG